jgi:hypothetical protein
MEKNSENLALFISVTERGEFRGYRVFIALP